MSVRNVFNYPNDCSGLIFRVQDNNQYLNELTINIAYLLYFIGCFDFFDYFFIG